MFRQEMTNRTSHFFVAFSGTELAGYAGFWLLVDEIHITKVTVAAPFRGQGFGRELMEHLFAHGRRLNATNVRLEVRESNLPARALYDSLGFESVGTRAGYYARTGEAAIVMVRPLEPDGGQET
jgi:ribosomal-protein-alanine N-acetyltransferase